ncbi:MAG: hypothetical protein IPO08_06240 [Xanthomonadales bacterium]|nr:hypothetical protein [Xanthomonadales bacterium]
MNRAASWHERDAIGYDNRNLISCVGAYAPSGGPSEIFELGRIWIRFVVPAGIGGDEGIQGHEWLRDD